MTSSGRFEIPVLGIVINIFKVIFLPLIWKNLANSFTSRLLLSWANQCLSNLKGEFKSFALRSIEYLLEIVFRILMKLSTMYEILQLGVDDFSFIIDIGISVHKEV